MINLDEDSLICDLAETYNIYEYRNMPPSKVAIFARGLKDDSRIKMKQNNQKISFEKLLLTDIRDKVSLLFWSKTKDAQNNRNRPTLILQEILNKENDIQTFSSSKDFYTERLRLLNKSRRE